MPPRSIRRLIRLALHLLAVVLIGLTASLFGQEASTADGAATPAQIKQLIDDAGALYKQKEMAQAGEKIKLAQAALKTLLDSGVDANQLFELRPNYARLKRAHEMLEAEGIALEALIALPNAANKKSRSANKSAALDDNAADMKENPSGNSQTTDSANKEAEQKGDVKTKSTVSFTKQIAPLLARNCGMCHVQGRRGEVNFVSYTSLVSDEAGLVSAGQPDLSDLFTAVDSNVMPPQRKLTAKDKATIKTWIAEGAQFDGDDQDASLMNFAGPGGGQRRR